MLKENWFGMVNVLLLVGLVVAAQRLQSEQAAKQESLLLAGSASTTPSVPAFGGTSASLETLAQASSPENLTSPTTTTSIVTQSATVAPTQPTTKLKPRVSVPPPPPGFDEDDD